MSGVEAIIYKAFIGALFGAVMFIIYAAGRWMVDKVAKIKARLAARP